MARHDDGNGIAPIGSTDRTTCRRTAELLREISVGPRAAERNGKQCVPHALLECRSAKIERYRELLSRASKVLTELALCFRKSSFSQSTATSPTSLATSFNLPTGDGQYRKNKLMARPPSLEHGGVRAVA